MSLLKNRVLIDLKMQSSLRILNIAGNKMDSLGEIGSLVNLEVLDASNNLLNDMKEMSVMLKCWPRLTNLDLTGNPICSKNKYRERIIVLAANIRVLDGKEIPEMSRKFLENWKLSKEMSAAAASMSNQQQQFASGLMQQQKLLNRNVADADFSNYVQQPSAYNSASLNRHARINAMPTYIMPGIVFKLYTITASYQQ